MSKSVHFSIDDELISLLANHKDRKKYKTESAFIRTIVKDWLVRNSGELLTAIQPHLSEAEKTYITAQYDKEAYNYDICKQFKKDAIPGRSLLEITKEIYIMKRNVFKNIDPFSGADLPSIEELESKL